ncbi:hypothetical protein C8A05DRAFT_47352 [Staphylotrichum tortipilum]|uniref:Uncharacterized protein n=1 Tax=Staphylotrichum tortipilum TaxID=2831512 RepID=A0AAN6ME52_9PEZI|nr:hypothetical protein C8A05DRAFT_47352 [Staphylotrichum longicolle]
MVLPLCFLHIPALPDIAYLSGTPVQALVAYAPTHTNYVGGTSCALTSYVTPTPRTNFDPLPTAKCVLPASVSGKAYSVTPFIFGPKTVSSTVIRTYWNCDPIPVANINKGNFKIACKTLIGKNYLPTAAGVSLYPYTFVAVKPTSTPKYIVNTALAKTTLIPTTEVRVETTSTTTKTLMSTSIVRATSTCLVTVTVTPVPAARRADSPNLAPDSVAVNDLAHDHGNDTNAVMELKERAAVTPTLGKPDFTYPPYGVTTIYVKSISTTVWTARYVTTVKKTLSGVTTTTTSYLGYTVSTVTVTRAPVA